MLSLTHNTKVKGKAEPVRSEGGKLFGVGDFAGPRGLVLLYPPHVKPWRSRKFPQAADTVFGGLWMTNKL